MNTNILTVNGKEFSNNNAIPLELGILFGYHSSLYDGKPVSATHLSVSNLIGPMKKVLYAINYPTQSDLTDLSSIAKSSLGTIVHTGLEQALDAYGGYMQEKRSEVIIDGVTLSGKFDYITPDGELGDLKNVSSYAYKLLMEDKEALQPGLSMEEMYSLHPTYFKFAAQLSFYAMLNPDLVKQPYGHILFNLTSASFDNYPTYSKVRFPLFPAEQVMEFATNRINIIKQHLADGTYPLCSSNEMGSKPAEYKVLRMNKSGKWATVRGSKSSSLSDTQAFIASKGKVGDKLDETPARHILCGYCSYANLCPQFTGNV